MNSINKLKTVCVVIVLSLIMAACRPNLQIIPKQLLQNEDACYKFLKNNMFKDGGIKTNFHEKPISVELATGKEVLSESQGLLMYYTAQILDRETFDSAYSFTRTYLDNGKMFVYRYNPDAEKNMPYAINAAVDDLRIIKALLYAGDVFEDKALTKDAIKFAGRFYETNVENNLIYDFYDSNIYMKNDFITLCYLDLESLQLISQHDERFNSLYDNSIGIIENGYISDDFPMFMTRYNYKNGKYEAPNGINMVESVLSAYNLSLADKCPSSTIEFLKEKLEDEKIYASYEIDGTPRARFESTAIYALTALLALEVDDRQMYEKSVELMNKYMVIDKNSSIYGAFGDDKDIYSFDNLMALLAYRKGVQ